jgi:hypothetical protein
MLCRLGLLCSVLAMFFIAGGHWTVLQTIAWAEMLHDYSQRTGSLTVAVEQTFDGQHPCNFCREIRVAKAQEHKSSPIAPGVEQDAKVKALLAESVLPLAEPAVNTTFFWSSVLPAGSSRAEQPPTPPPRQGKSVA